MSASTWDVVTVGGGLAGAGLARLMAAAGARVLVLERSGAFRDRVRGEVLMPWGVAEAERLGFDGVLRPVSNELRTWVTAVGGTTILERDVVPLSRLGRAVLTYYHPAMQDLLLEAATAAGAEIRRDARVTGVRTGTPATVSFQHVNGTHEARARLVIGADGRGSAVRSSAGFATRRDPERRLFAGVLFDDHRAPADVLYRDSCRERVS